MLYPNRDLLINIDTGGKLMEAFFFCRNRSSVQFYGHFLVGHFVKNGDFWQFSTFDPWCSETQRPSRKVISLALTFDPGEHILFIRNRFASSLL